MRRLSPQEILDEAMANFRRMMPHPLGDDSRFLAIAEAMFRTTIEMETALLDQIYPKTMTPEELDKRMSERDQHFACSHKWVEYTGLNEVFEHCSYCGAKK